MPEWRESLAIGVEEIDNQHKELIRRFDDLLSACGEGGKGMAELKGLLTFLDDYIVEHFRDEEKLQESSGYPEFEEHKKLHDAFIERIFELQNEILIEGMAVHHVLETNNILLKWLINHISVEDKKLGKFLRGSNV
jgi:hemerythrin